MNKIKIKKPYNIGKSKSVGPLPIHEDKKKSGMKLIMDKVAYLATGQNHISHSFRKFY